jgi:hypothetical protein
MNLKSAMAAARHPFDDVLIAREGRRLVSLTGKGSADRDRARQASPWTTCDSVRTRPNALVRTSFELARTTNAIGDGS